MTDDYATTDVLVVGSGIAGCGAALSAARAGADVLLVTKASEPEDAASDWAQGGIATTRSDPEGFRADVLAAGDGEADPDAVDVLVGEAREAVADVLVDTLGVEFDGDGDDGGFDYAREAAHSSARILHVDAATGRHVLRPFLSHLADHDRVRVVEDTAALELITHEGRVHGALFDREVPGAPGGASGDEKPRAAAPAGEPVFAGATVLATGGIGDCYPDSTNPSGATGDGIAMAALAGADTADMEYVQFHPTAYPGGEDGGPFLVSEAVRGEGATLVNGDGERFMPDYHTDAELAPRDVVARAVDRERAATGEVRLDVSGVDFRGEFPGLADECDDRGLTLGAGIPVAPAEHFLCGGIDVDDRGRASLDRLFAVGECARTGVHGANRLASTSLLEGLVWGRRAGETAAEAGAGEATPVEPPELLDRDPALPERFAAEKFTRLRRVMDEHVGLRRDPEGLGRATAVLRRLKGEVDAYVRTRTARDLYELRNASVVALLVARAAADNPESAGCHHVETDGAEPATPAGGD
jgi:L-aspartate oxidase